MKSHLATLVLLSAAFGVMAQTPPAPVPTKPRLALTTDAFEDGGIIPNKFTMAAEGTPVSPKLTWTNVPDGTVSFALILIDPDTAVMKKTDEVLHWLIFNIPGTARDLPERVPAQAQLPDGSVQGLNEGKKVGYMGMGAAAVGPYHHYTFELFALDTKLTLGPEATQSDVMKAMDGHILMKGVLVGRFPPAIVQRSRAAISGNSDLIQTVPISRRQSPEALMQFIRTSRFIRCFLTMLSALCLFTSSAAAQTPSNPSKETKSQSCANDDSGLKLPPGFCATIFADGVGHARHMAVTPSGVVYVNTWSGEYYGNDTPHAGGFLVALQDTSGLGKAKVVERFGETVQNGGAGGTGIGIYKSWLYAEINDRIVRYSLSASSLVPKDAPVTIVSGLPLGGDHPMHPFIIDANGAMYVDVASASNSCQLKNRTLKSPGADPCVELETRGGIWRYDANKTNQSFSKADRFATGIRNGEGFAIDAGGRLFVTQHGRDQLHTNWPDLYKPDQEATLPAEEVLLLRQGGDYGWPECYYDSFVSKLVLAPEYGGDGKKIGMCENKIAPAASFPAHWAPNGMVHYDGKEFPKRYRDGVFIAFHGSWNRAPYPQGGYNVVFQPMTDGHAAGRCEIFADGFAGAVKSPDKAAHRPSGLAVGPDGALYVSDDIRGRIYRIVYQGGAGDGTAGVTPCPSATAPAGEIVETPAGPPEGTHPDAAAAAALPSGVTPEMIALGERVYRGQVGGAACTGCHGDKGQGSTLGPDLTGKKWLWSDGSYAGIKKTITEGVSQPKNYRSPMPAMGGAQLTADQLSALAAYIWSIGHQKTQ